MAIEELLVGVRIPDNIRDYVQQYQDEKDINLASSAVEIILQEYFQMRNGSEYVLLGQFRELEEKVMILSRQIETLTAAIPSSASVKTNFTVADSIASIAEEVEDEPCEVLTAFLE